MKPEQFADFFENPGKLDSASVSAFEEIIKEFPFCQPAQLLFLKGLQNDGNIRFNRQLKIASAYAANRRILFELLNLPKVVEDEIHARPEEVESPDFTGIQQATATEVPTGEPEKADPVLRSGHFPSIADLDLIPFDFPTYSDSDSPGLYPPAMARKTPADELIDRFIQNPGSKVLRPDHAPVPNRDFSLGSEQEDEEFLTETLARIYVEQGYYLKAIQAYEKLSLKIPEKSVYFASQIEMVRELIKKQ